VQGAWSLGGWMLALTLVFFMSEYLLDSEFRVVVQAWLRRRKARTA
jgi:hypothetical protein